MAGITNLAKGAVKNIAQAWGTDGVKKALLKRAAVGAGIGAVGGGTLSAIQGGSFGEGAVRGGFVGAGIGAATGAYKMGAFGNSVLDEAGRFRKGATSVYSHIADGTATWEQVNKYRQKDFDSFMNHIQNAREGQKLSNKYWEKDLEAKKGHQQRSSDAHKESQKHRKKDSSAKQDHTEAANNAQQEVANNTTKDTAATTTHTEAANNAQQEAANNTAKKEYKRPVIGEVQVQGPKPNDAPFFSQYDHMGYGGNIFEQLPMAEIKNMDKKTKRAIQKEQRKAANKIFNSEEFKTLKDGSNSYREIMTKIENNDNFRKAFEDLGYDFKKKEFTELKGNNTYNKYLQKQKKEMAKNVAKRTQAGSLF